MPARPSDAPGPTSTTIGRTGKLARDQRVRRRREYVDIQENGHRVHTAAFTVVARPRDEGDGPRLGYAVSRRVGNAVVRNRVRRLVKELFRRQAAELPAVDFVVIAKPSAAEVGREGFDRLASELGPAFIRAARALADKRSRTRGEPPRRGSRDAGGRDETGSRNDR